MSLGFLSRCARAAQERLHKLAKISVPSPHVYCHESSSWVPVNPASMSSPEPLARGQSIKLASWSLRYRYKHPLPDLGSLTTVAMDHLRDLFGPTPGHLVVLLQHLDVHKIREVQDHPWVQQNFILSDANLYVRETIKKSPLALTIFKFLVGSPAITAHTLAMVSKTLPHPHCSRIPFSYETKETLLVGIPIKSGSPGTELADTPESLGLCSLDLGYGYWLDHSRQLASVSRLLQGADAAGNKIVGGVVAGSIGAPKEEEYAYYKPAEIGLKDVWDDVPTQIQTPPTTGTTCGWAGGETLIRLPRERNGRRGRIARFLYSGSVQTSTVYNAQDVMGRVGRFGIGIPYQEPSKPNLVDCQKLADERAAALKSRASSPPTYAYPRPPNQTWGFLHCGIVTGVMVPKIKPQPESRPVRRLVKYLGTI